MATATEYRRPFFDPNDVLFMRCLTTCAIVAVLFVIVSRDVGKILKVRLPVATGRCPFPMVTTCRPPRLGVAPPRNPLCVET